MNDAVRAGDIERAFTCADFCYAYLEFVYALEYNLWASPIKCAAALARGVKDGIIDAAKTISEQPLLYIAETVAWAKVPVRTHIMCTIGIYDY